MSGAVGGEDACLMEGGADIDKVEYRLKLTGTTLTWTRGADLPGKSSETCVPVREIVYVKPYTGKHSPEGTVDGFTVCYVKHKKKSVLKRASEHFVTDTVTAQSWIQKIQALIDDLTQRPRKCLVIVNPVSGRNKGPQACRDIVVPVFKEANIQTEVVVTERAHHTEEVLAKYDLSSIDSLVLVGGDGLYHEAVNGLQTRLMAEAGLGRDSPEADIPPVPLPIGLIPCGTGNGLAFGSYGCLDVETAALAIMIGKKMDNNIFTVFSGNKLISYSICVLGYVLFSDIIYAAEKRRYLGKLRYLVSTLEYILIRFGRRANITMDYLTVQPSVDKPAEPSLDCTQEASADNVKETSDSHPKTTDPQADCSTVGAAGTSDTVATEWKSVSGPFICLMVFHTDISKVFNFLEGEAEAEGPSVMVDDDYTRFTLIKPCSRGFIMKLFMQIFKTETSYLSSDKVVHDLVKEFKIRVDEPSDPGSETGIKDHMLNIDGELYQIPEPAFHVKLHTKRIRMFSSKHDT